MKKLLAYLFIFTLLHNSLLVPVTINLAGIKTAALQKKEQIVRFWQCATSKKRQCLPEEISRTRRWFAGISLATLVAIFAAIGLKVRKDKLAQIKEEQAFAALKEKYDKKSDEIVQGALAPSSFAKFQNIKNLEGQRQAIAAEMQANFPRQYERWFGRK